ncbi:MAG: c-type cytochrome [Deltaproteobacteria bacterium]|nr:c-type cytochrome [Deltaproteobacteria bacterium]
MKRMPRYWVACAVVGVCVPVLAGELAIKLNGPLPEGPRESAVAFEQLRCSTCHTVGAGPDRGGPNLGRLDLRVSFLDGAARLWNHFPGMQARMRELHVPYPAITGDALVNLVALFTSYQYYLTRVGRPGVSPRGEALFATKGCAACHSFESGAKSTGPNLTAYSAGRSTLDVAQAMWNHGPAMQKTLEARAIARPSFRKGEMADLLAYIATRGAPPGTVSATLEPGSPKRGAAVFQARGCGRCHAVRGVGGGLKGGANPAPDLGRQPDAFVRDYTDVAGVLWNHAVPMWDRMRREGVSVAPLVGNDLADLVAFLFFVNFADETGDVTRGATVFDRKGCGACHAIGEPRNGDPAPSLGRAAGLDRPQDVLAAMWRAAPKMQREMAKRATEWPQFAPGEFADLIAFVKDRRSKPPRPPVKLGAP